MLRHHPSRLQTQRASGFLARTRANASSACSILFALCCVCQAVYTEERSSILSLLEPARGKSSTIAKGIQDVKAMLAACDEAERKVVVDIDTYFARQHGHVDARSRELVKLREPSPLPREPPCSHSWTV